LLVGLQLALSLPLLVGAGLLARTVYNLQHADVGYPAERLLLARVDLRQAADQASRADAVRDEMLEAIQRLPGVRAVSFSHLGLFTGGESSTSVEVEGYVPKGDDDRGSARDIVGPGYFSALGARMLVGRELVDSDRAGSPDVCVVNEAFAKRFFEGRHPIGLRLTIRRDNQKADTYDVVGVAADTWTQSLRDEVVPRYFVAAAQPPHVSLTPTFLIRTTRASASVSGAVRDAIQHAAPAIPIMSMATIEEQLAPLIAQDRTTAQLVLVFGAVALTLAAIGLYGVLAYGIARRTSEIAVRIALGAQPSGVISMIVRETLGFVVVGVAVGGGVALSMSRVIDSRLYGVAAHDPPTLAIATALLLAVALLAAYLPARRASKLDPMAALRRS
jgi:predicted permease